MTPRRMHRWTSQITLLHLLLILIGLLSMSSTEDNNSTEIDRSARFFSLFTIIRFANTECGGIGSFTGTCFTRRECTNLAGTNIGSCASKRGVCCVVQRTCGGTTDVNSTYFSNPGYPRSFSNAGSCSITIHRCNPDICQMRLDLLDFSLSQPDGTGNCVNDVMTISGGGSRVPRICGENSGQHVYVDFNGNNIITLSILTNTGINFNRRWNIKITQLACNCPTLAPSGCLMYYTGVSGTVSSFNFGNMVNEITGTRELANLNYGVCVRMELGYCSITWSQSSDPYSFTVTGDVIGLGGIVGTPNAEMSGATCTTDYIVIPNPVGQSSDRFCGSGLAPKTTFTKPFVLNVVTNGDEGPPPPDVANRGFVLMYTQQICSPL